MWDILIILVFSVVVFLGCDKQPLWTVKLGKRGDDPGDDPDVQKYKIINLALSDPTKLTKLMYVCMYVQGVSKKVCSLAKAKLGLQ